MIFELKAKQWEGDRRADSGAECPRQESSKCQGLACIQNRGNEAEPRAWSQGGAALGETGGVGGESCKGEGGRSRNGVGEGVRVMLEKQAVLLYRMS